MKEIEFKIEGVKNSFIPSVMNTLNTYFYDRDLLARVIVSLLTNTTRGESFITVSLKVEHDAYWIVALQELKQWAAEQNLTIAS